MSFRVLDHEDEDNASVSDDGDDLGDRFRVADGNGLALETQAIQSAVDACADRGGGGDESVVFFPPGEYLMGTVFLRSNTILYIDQGAILLGSPKQLDYPDEKSRWYVVLAENVENVGITGGGVIDGQGLKFVTKFNRRKNVMISWNTTGACLGDECRPRLVGFVNCRHARVWDIHLRQSAYWSLHIASSEFVYVHGVTIYGDFNTPNNDGIDVDGSNNTVITNCHIDTADDGVIGKSIAGPLFNLSVTNSWIRSKSSALKIGSETYHDVASLRFVNVTVVDSHRGLGIQLRDSGHISNVVFSNITLTTRFYDPLWWGRAEPIYVTACPRNSSTSVGSIHNVSFVNIRAVSENGIFLAGSGGGTLRHITLSNVELSLAKTTIFPGGLHDFRPGCQGLVPSRTSGVFMQHLSEATLQNVHLSWRVNKLEDWDLPLDFAPQSVGRINLLGFSSSVSQ